MTIPVRLFDDIAKMNADPKHNLTVLGDTRIALNHRALHRDGATHGFDHAPELDQRPVARALEHPPILAGDGRVDGLDT